MGVVWSSVHGRLGPVAEEVCEAGWPGHCRRHRPLPSFSHSSSPRQCMLSILSVNQNVRIARCIWSNTLLGYVSLKPHLVVTVWPLFLLAGNVFALANCSWGLGSLPLPLFCSCRIGSLYRCRELLGVGAAPAFFLGPRRVRNFADPAASRPPLCCPIQSLGHTRNYLSIRGFCAHVAGASAPLFGSSS